mmetsp:Transcript_29034/g.74662  ORF Transcript_29034/g.74662 Transcript_29034/m.74662 type:complete len:327 (+) Transcript_29034:675-1655(+)
MPMPGVTNAAWAVATSAGSDLGVDGVMTGGAASLSASPSGSCVPFDSAEGDRSRGRLPISPPCSHMARRRPPLELPLSRWTNVPPPLPTSIGPPSMSSLDPCCTKVPTNVPTNVPREDEPTSPSRATGAEGADGGGGCGGGSSGSSGLPIAMRSSRATSEIRRRCSGSSVGSIGGSSVVLSSGGIGGSSVVLSSGGESDGACGGSGSGTLEEEGQFCSRHAAREGIASTTSLVSSPDCCAPRPLSAMKSSSKSSSTLARPEGCLTSARERKRPNSGDHLSGSLSVGAGCVGMKSSAAIAGAPPSGGSDSAISIAVMPRDQTSAFLL